MNDVETITFYFNKRLGHEPSPEQLAAYLEWRRAGATDVMIDDNLAREPEAIEFAARAALPYLEVSGSNFVNDAGERKVLCGCDQFVAFRQFLDGVDLMPLFRESRELGFDMWRVFLMGSVKQNNILELRIEDGYYEHLRVFADFLNARGIVLLATVFVDAQDIMPSVGTQRAHWVAVADALRGTATLLSGGNQYPKNGWRPSDLTDPGMLWSRGSSTADPDPFAPKPNGASFMEFHGRRDYPAMMLDAVASPVTLQTRDKLFVPLIMSEPIGHAETPRVNSRNSDPWISRRLAQHFSIECAGAVFHNDAGMRGQVMGPGVRACAEAWQQGMRV